MRPGVPWNIKGIDSETREAAMAAARRAGLSLGDWLAQTIATEATGAAPAVREAASQSVPFTNTARLQAVPLPQSPARVPPYPMQTPATVAGETPAASLNAQIRNGEFAIVAHSLRELADRLDSTERRSQAAIDKVSQSLGALSEKAEAAERIKFMAETAFQSAAEVLNQSAKDQAHVFDTLQETVNSLTVRMEGMEARDWADEEARGSVSALESSLADIRERLASAETNSSKAQASLDTWVRDLTSRLDQSEQVSRNLAEKTEGLAKAEALESVQLAVIGMRQEILETDRRAREAATGLETWIKDLGEKIDGAEAARDSWTANWQQSWTQAAKSFATHDDLRALSSTLNEIRDHAGQVSQDSAEDLKEGLEQLKTELRQDAQTRSREQDRAARESQAALESWIRRISERMEQSVESQSAQSRTTETTLAKTAARLDAVDAREAQLLAEIREGMARVDAKLAEHQTQLAGADQTGAIMALRQSLNDLSQSFNATEAGNSQSAQRTTQAIRKIEDILRTVSGDLESFRDLANGPLAAPMKAVQATLETVSTRLEDSDRRVAQSINTMESALKALAGRIDETDAKQSSRAGRTDQAIQALGERLEQSEQRTTDAIGVVEAGMSTISQRLDSAERRHKDAIAGLRQTIDTLSNRADLTPQSLLDVAPPKHARQAAPAKPAAAPAPAMPQVPHSDAMETETGEHDLPPLAGPAQSTPTVHIQGSSKVETSGTAKQPAPAPVLEAELPPMASAATQAPVAPQPANGMSTADVTRLLSGAATVPPPAFEDALARNEPTLDGSFHEDVAPKPQPRKADDFLSQARRAAQAAAKAEAEAAPPKKGIFGREKDVYSADGTGGNLMRLIIVGSAFVALVAGVIAVVVSMPGSGEPGDPNRPGPSSSIGEVFGSKPSSNPQLPYQALPPAVAAKAPVPMVSGSGIPASALPAAPSMDVPGRRPQAQRNPFGQFGQPGTSQQQAAQPVSPATAVEPGPADAAKTEFLRIQEAANKGDARAQYRLAMRYFDGQGTIKDRVQATSFFARSAKQGYTMAQYRLGAAYEQGIGVTKDIKQARQWYEKAASGGNRKAMHNLAVLYAESNAPEAMRDAARWFSEGATAGLTDSQYNLGVLFERGMGVEKNPVESAKWFAIAAAQGDSEAPAKLEALRKQLSASQIALALEGARNFKPKALNPEANEGPGG